MAETARIGNHEFEVEDGERPTPPLPSRPSRPPQARCPYVACDFTGTTEQVHDHLDSKH